MEIDKTAVESLCEGMPEDIQQRINAAYWTGCLEGMEVANEKRKIVKQEGNVVYLELPNPPAVKWLPRSNP